MNLESLFRTAWSRALCALVIVVVVALVSLAASQNASLDDDYTIALSLSGMYPGSGLCLFVNGVLSCLVASLNALVPGMNAFYAVEFAVFLLSLGLFSFAALTYLGSKSQGLLVIGAVIVLLAPGCTFDKNFTVVAAFATLAGAFLVVSQVGVARPSRGLACAGVLLCLCGFLLRIQSFLLALPFFALALAVRILKAREEGVLSRDRLLGDVLAPAAALIVLCGACMAADALLWDDQPWKYWSDYNVARTMLSDYPMPPYAAAEGELADLGVSELDYRFALTWRTGDPDFFTLERMQGLAALSGATEFAGMRALLSGLTSVTVKDWHVALAFAVVLLVVVLAKMRTGRIGRVPLLGAVAVTAAGFAACAVFVYVGRAPTRVVYPVWAFALAAVALAVSAPSSGSNGTETWKRVSRAAGSVSGIACAAALVFFAASAQPSVDAFAHAVVGDRSPYAGGSSVASYIHEHEGPFVMDVFTMADFEYDYGLRDLPVQDDLLRCISLGGWTVGAPYIAERNAEMGLANPMRDIAVNGEARFVTSTDGYASELESYLEQHYYDDVSCELADSFVTDKGTTYNVYHYTVGLSSKST